MFEFSPLCTINSAFKDDYENDPEQILDDEDFCKGFNPFNHQDNDYTVAKAFEMELKPSITEALRKCEEDFSKEKRKPSQCLQEEQSV